MYKPEVETVPQTGSTRKLSNENRYRRYLNGYTYIFWDKFFADLYANITRRFFHAKFQHGGRMPEVA